MSGACGDGRVWKVTKVCGECDKLVAAVFILFYLPFPPSLTHARTHAYTHTLTHDAWFVQLRFQLYLLCINVSVNDVLPLCLLLYHNFAVLWLAWMWSKYTLHHDTFVYTWQWSRITSSVLFTMRRASLLFSLCVSVCLSVSFVWARARCKMSYMHIYYPSIKELYLVLSLFLSSNQRVKIRDGFLLRQFVGSIWLQRLLLCTKR